MLEIRKKGVVYILYQDGKQLNKKSGRPFWFLEKEKAQKALLKIQKEQEGTWFEKIIKAPEQNKDYVIKTVGKNYPFFGKLAATKSYGRIITKRGWFAVYLNNELIYEVPPKKEPIKRNAY